MKFSIVVAVASLSVSVVALAAAGASLGVMNEVVERLYFGK